MSSNRSVSLVNASSASNIPFILAADLATAGTVNVSYPTGKNRGNFVLGVDHKLSWGGGNVAVWPKDFEVTLNTANVTLTWRNATTIPAGSRVVLTLDEPGMGPRWRDPNTGDLTGAIANGQGLAIIQLGSPAAASATAILNASVPGNRASSGDYSMTANVGSLVSGGVATLNSDCPGGRSLQVVSSAVGDTTQTITIVGTDCYGQDMREARTMNGTTIVNFVKAFARITRINTSAVLAGNLSVGTNTVLGISVFLGFSALVLRELVDGATAGAGTFVAGATVTPTATSADVRGTYVPALAPDGSRTWHLIAALADPGYMGGPQFTG